MFSGYALCGFFLVTHILAGVLGWMIGSGRIRINFKKPIQ
jgi:hypothetical protein